MADYPWLPELDALGYLDVAQGADQAADVERCRLAACAVVERQRPDLVDATGTFVPGDAVRHGTLLLVGRLYARKGSPQGVATFGELGAASILRHDPDVGQLIGVGRYAFPRIG